MQDAGTIIRQPILLGLLISIAIHIAILHNRAIWIPPVPHMETGRTAIQLTLLPSPSVAKADSTAKQTAIESVTAQNDEPDREITPYREAAAAQSPTPPVQTEEQKGITSPAVAKSTFHPTYPRTSRRRGEQGTVILLIQVLPDGTAGEIEILQSSGYERLDRAAAEAAGRTAYDPAIILGRPIESSVKLSYTYRLTND